MRKEENVASAAIDEQEYGFVGDAKELQGSRLDSHRLITLRISLSREACWLSNKFAMVMVGRGSRVVV